MEKPNEAADQRLPLPALPEGIRPTKRKAVDQKLLRHHRAVCAAAIAEAKQKENEMSEPTQAEKCAGLAQAMGGD